MHSLLLHFLRFSLFAQTTLPTYLHLLSTYLCPFTLPTYLLGKMLFRTVQGFVGALKKVVSPKRAFVAMRAVRDEEKRTLPRTDSGRQQTIHTFDDMDYGPPWTDRHTDSSTETYQRVHAAWHQWNIGPTCYLYRIPSNSICEQLLSKLFQRSLCPKDLYVLPNLRYVSYQSYLRSVHSPHWDGKKDDTHGLRTTTNHTDLWWHGPRTTTDGQTHGFRHRNIPKSARGMTPMKHRSHLLLI